MERLKTMDEQQAIAASREALGADDVTVSEHEPFILAHPDIVAQYEVSPQVGFRRRASTTVDDAKELRALLAKATPGEWVARGEDVTGPEDPTTPRGYCAWERYVDCRSIWDAELIAAMRNSLPALLDRLERAEARGEAARELARGWDASARISRECAESQVTTTYGERCRAEADAREACSRSLRAALDDEAPR